MIKTPKFVNIPFCALLLIAGAFPSNGLSQTKQCDIELKTFDSISNKEVSNFSVRLMSIDEDSYEWKNADGDIYLVRNLTENTYNVGVKHKNYRTSSYDFDLDCAKASPNGVFSISIPLWNNKNFNSSVFVKFDKNVGKIVRYFPKATTGWIGITATITGFGDGITFSTIDGGVVNEKAIELVKPKFTKEMFENETAKKVEVEVIIDLDGSVEAAEGLTRNPIVNKIAVAAAMESKFRTTKYQEEPAKVSGRIVYDISHQVL